MNKNTKLLILVIGIIIVIAVVAGFMFMNNNKNQDNNNTNSGNENQVKPEVELNTEEDLKNLITKTYEKTTIELPRLNTNVIDVNDSNALKYNTGLDSNEGIEAVVVSEPLMTSQAYSLVLVKVKDGSDVEKVKQNMFNNIDTRKWICVEAEKVYATDSQNVVCLVMSSEEWAKPVYDSLKTLLGTTGKELEK